MTTIQHVEAQKLLPLICSAAATHRLLTYQTAAKAVGRNSQTNARMVAQVCDLLDAAAALAGVPLLALVTVREKSGDINRKAWAGNPDREAIIDRSLHHPFSGRDFSAMSQALRELDGRGNHAAWQYVRERFSDEQLHRRLTAPWRAQWTTPTSPLSSTGNSTVEGGPDDSDAIDDLGTDLPSRVNYSGVRYARDPKIREAVKRRAAGKCEYCGRPGFRSSDGSRYVECHHIIALADDGADRMRNVIALCPEHHREAHFGERCDELEKEMIRKVSRLQQSNAE